jgi:hypothetical protein
LLGVGGAAGSEYRVEVAGETVSGSVWFQSEHQVGVTVDQWGDGLLVLSYIEPGEAKPSGSAMAVLTFYGVDDEELAAVGGRWEEWWTPLYPPQAPTGS